MMTSRPCICPFCGRGMTVCDILGADHERQGKDESWLFRFHANSRPIGASWKSLSTNNLLQSSELIVLNVFKDHTDVGDKYGLQLEVSSYEFIFLKLVMLKHRAEGNSHMVRATRVGTARGVILCINVKECWFILKFKTLQHIEVYSILPPRSGRTRVPNHRPNMVAHQCYEHVERQPVLKSSRTISKPHHLRMNTDCGNYRYLSNRCVIHISDPDSHSYTTGLITIPQRGRTMLL